MSAKPDSLLDLHEPLPIPAIPVQPTAAPLDGLEVAETGLDEWLAAGGDRRSQPRIETVEST